MDFSVMEIVYLVAFFLGLGFAVLSALLSDVFHGHSGAFGDIDVGGHAPDINTGGGHTVHEGGVHFPVLSPVTISTFVASFGGTGIILFKLYPQWGTAVHIPVSIVAAGVVAVVVAYLFYRLFGNAEMTSAPRESDLIGLEASITVSIPKDGVGKISYLSMGSAFTAPAKSIDKEDLAQGSKVKIVRIEGPIYLVQKIQ